MRNLPLLLLCSWLGLNKLPAQKPHLIVPQSHSINLANVDFSEDGQLIYTSSIDGTTKIWESATGHLFHTIFGNPSIIVPFSLETIGQRLAIGSEFHIATLWDLRNGQKIRTFPGEYSFGLRFTSSPDGSVFVYGDETGLIEAKRMDTGQLVATKKRHTDEILELAYSKDGKYIFSLGAEDTLKVWQSDTWRLVAQLGGLQIDEQHLYFVENQPQLIFGSTTGQIYTWSFLDNQLQDFGTPGARLTSLSSSNNGALVLSSREDGTIRLWDTQRQQSVFTKSLAGLARARISNNGRFFVGGFENGTVQCWDTQRQKLLWTQSPFAAELNLLRFSPDGQYLITGSINEMETTAAYLWETSSGRLIHQLDGRSKLIESICLSPDNRYLVAGRSDGSVHIWDNGRSYLKRAFKAHAFGVKSIDFSPDGRQFLTTGDDPSIKIWDFESGQLLETLEGPEKWISSARFSPDGTKIVSIGGDKEAFVWDLKKNGPAFKIGTTRANFTSVVFSSDSRFILTSGVKGVATIWDLERKELMRSFSHSPSPLTTAVFSKTGQTIITVSADGTTKYWDLNTGAVTKLIPTPMDFISNARFSADQRYLFQSNLDADGKVWDLNTGKVKPALMKHTKEMLDATFASDVQFLVTTSYDNTIKFWDLSKPKEKGTLISLMDQDWVLTNPEGLFDASNQAMNTMHYVINDQNRWESIDIQQLKTRYYEPGLLAKITGFSNDPIRPVSAFNEVDLYPEVMDYEIMGDQLKIKLKARNGGLGKTPIFINGKEVSPDANPLPRGENSRQSEQIQFDLKPHQKYLLQHPDSTNLVQFQTYNEGGWLKSKVYQIEYNVVRARGNSSGTGNAWQGQFDPKMYVVCVGTSNYNGDQLDLKYADQDATMIAQAIATVGTNLFAQGDSLEVYCLTTASADSTGLENTTINWQFSNKNNIQSTLEKIQSQAKAEDILMVYFSGHGVTYGSSEQSQFHYLTQGIGSEDLSDEMIRKAYTISSNELTDWINAVPALKQVLIIDACNSGQIVNNLSASKKNLSSSQIRAIDRMQDRTGMFVLSGSAADKVSYEASAYGQGLLTYALLQGMRGLATRKMVEGEAVDVMRLFQYARDEVPRLAATISGVQTPMLGFPSQAASFDLGLLDEVAKAKLPLTNAKPIMIRSTFLNQNTLRDDLQLSARLNTAFRKETEKGQKANLIFVDVEQYPNAYSLGGLYTIKNERIQLKLKLLKGEESTNIEIRATDDPDRLVKSIRRAVFQKIKD